MKTNISNIKRIWGFKIDTSRALYGVLVFGVMLVLVLTLVRVVVNAKSNYDVFLSEKQSLNDLLNENDSLKQELNYYQSYEFKELYARDNLNLAEPGQTLYKIEGSTETYKPYTPTITVGEGQFGYADWWLKIISGSTTLQPQQNQ